MKLIADVLGYLVLFCSLVGSQFPKRWHMLIWSAVANLFAGVSVILTVGQLNSASVANFIAVVQIIINTVHCLKDEKVSLVEKVIFTIVYFIMCVLCYKTPWDIMTTVATMIFMISTFEKNPQKARIMGLGNTVLYIIYYIVIGNTMVLSQVLCGVSTVLAIYRYRSKG